MDLYKGFNFDEFWDDNDYSIEEYLSKPVTNKEIKTVESELKYKLPKSYIELMKLHNGGMVLKKCYPMSQPTSWADNHIQIEGIFGIGHELSNSLCGETGSQFWIDEWEYPAFGVYICDTPSAGHDMIMLDYRKCGKEGEPEIVHVDQDYDYNITFVAKDFETFVNGLASKEQFYW